MLRGYRFYIAALGLALASITHANAESGKQESQAEQSAPKSLSDIATASRQQAERAKRTDQDEAPCGAGKYGSSADLCAQWKAADAASDSAWWAWAGGIIGLGSLVGVLAAIALAFHSNWIARETARRQLRAYIEISESTVGIYPDEGEIILQITLKNCGQTPAYKVRLMGESFASPYPMEEERPFIPIDHEDWSTSVGPGMTYACVKRLFCDDVALAVDEARARRLCPYIQGICEYEDAFGKVRETYFRYAFAGIVSDTGLVMQPARTGNYST